MDKIEINGLTLQARRNRNRTELYEDSLYVGIIIQMPTGTRAPQHQWLTRHSGGFAGSFDAALDAVGKELSR